MKYVHTNIVSTNWKILVDFYINTFECKIIPPIRKQSGAWLDKGTGVVNAALVGAHLLLPGHGEHGPTLEIYQYNIIENQDWVAPNTRGFGHIAFEVESVASVLETVARNGGSPCGEITKRKIAGVGEITFVYARDPEGNLIELQSWKKES
ncbi:MAG: catechol 2,3-dioxygenase-like lactoylglutathione lyase family enzyme [Saprospiraceae bacterium]|jgi:catechol 2,3-dioxygenase-like lactoylglutathione lyase family enzyme